MENYKKHFRDKKITVMGLGLLGRGIGDVQFLAECGANLIVTDLKNKNELKPSLKKLSKYKNIEYVLGRHRHEDFKNRDMILKSAGVPIESPYIKTARKNKIPIEMSSSLLAKLSDATIIGITGTRGKSTVTQLVYEILKADKKRRVFLGGNVRGVATLPLLKKVKRGDLVVMELDSWQLQGFGDSKISPHISVFTTFLPDHMDYYGDSMTKYYRDKENIFKYQEDTDFLIVGKDVAKRIKKASKFPKSKLIVADGESIPKSWNITIPGLHNRDNIALAIEVTKALKIPQATIKKAVENFSGVEGRLQYLRTIRGIKIYNDNNATTPDATIAGLKALGNKKNIVLIMGGTNKGLDMSELVKTIPKYCKAVVLFKGSGTDRLKGAVSALSGIEVKEVDSLEEAMKQAIELSGDSVDTILYSPAFASFGKHFKNEYDRNDQFVEIVNKLNSNTKRFWAGGFLYNPVTHCVLLHKRDNKTIYNPNLWAFFGGLCEGDETPEQTFIREIGEELEIKIDKSDISPLCKYLNEELDTYRYVFFVESSKKKSEMNLTEGAGFDWISIDDIFGLEMTKHTEKNLELFISTL